MAATIAAMTRPPDPQHSRSLSISLSQLDRLATLAAARGHYVSKVSIKVVHKTASVILSILTGPVTAKKLADGSSQEPRKARTV